MRSLIFIILIFAGSNAFACIAKLIPDEGNFEKYSQIYIAEVTGVVLFEYEKHRKESINKGENRKWFSDITLPQKINAIVTKSFKGNPETKVSHEISGCAVVTPSPRMLGLFFIEKKNGKVIPIYENEGNHIL